MDKTNKFSGKFTAFMNCDNCTRVTNFPLILMENLCCECKVKKTKQIKAFKKRPKRPKSPIYRAGRVCGIIYNFLLANWIFFGMALEVMVFKLLKEKNKK